MGARFRWTSIQGLERLRGWIDMKFCFGDIVVVEGNLIGVVVKSWISRENNYDVYVRSFNRIINYKESEIERYMVRHKELDEEEMEWQSNAVNGR